MSERLPLPKPPEIEAKARPEVRVFCVAAIPVLQLEHELAEHQITDISLVEVMLVKQSEKLAAIGGSIDEGESLSAAAMRHVFEKTTLTRESLRVFDKDYGKLDIRPGVNEVLLPVRSRTFSPSMVRNGKNTNDHRAAEVMSVTPQEFRDLSLGGIAVSDEIARYEANFRKEMIVSVNRARRLHRQPKVSSLEECSGPEIVTAFISAQKQFGMRDEQIRDFENGHTPARPADSLTSALYLADVHPDQVLDAVVAPMTAEVRHIRNALKFSLRGTVAELYSAMERDITEFTGGKEHLSYLRTLDALKSIWPDYLNLPIEVKKTLLDRLNERFVTELSAYLGKPRALVERSLEMPDRLPRYLAHELISATPRFQEDHPLNELVNVKPFSRVLYILGYHPYRSVPKDLPRDLQRHLRGEAMIGWVHIFSAMTVAERPVDSDNDLFEGILETFTEYPPQEEIIKLGETSHKIYRRQTERYIGDRKLSLIIDERPRKTEERLVLKGYQQEIIRDDFSCNIVIAEKNFTEEERGDIFLRLAYVDALREAILDHFAETLAGSGWTATIIPESHKTRMLEDVQTYVRLPREARKDFEAKRNRGKRAGSKGDSIVRDKFVILLTNGNEQYYTEVSLYPFEGFDDITPLSESGFIDFVGKLADDSSGRYSGERLYKTHPDDPTAPAVIEMIEPPVWGQSGFEPFVDLQVK